MPLSRATCPVCGAELAHPRATTPNGNVSCPYDGLAYHELRGGHDQIYFGRWRKMDAGRNDIVRGYKQLGRHLRAIERTLEEKDLPAARHDLSKAFEAYHAADPEEDERDMLRFMDHALSYAHRAIDDLLHDMGLPPHSAMDFAEWYDAVEVPFRDEW